MSRELSPAELQAALRRLTPARISLGRVGASLPTSEVLGFALAHARARDAVHLPLDAAGIADRLAALPLDVVEVESAATSRDVYLRRPDLGRTLSAGSREALAGKRAAGADVALVIADGLSARAVHDHAIPFVQELLRLLHAASLTVGACCVARQARVALGDEIGQILQARVVAMVIGERPGLSSPDSLGLYLTFDPRPGRTDAERNCISNIRTEGLSYAEAAHRAAWLIREALRRKLTGVDLKDESGVALPLSSAAGVIGQG